MSTTNLEQYAVDMARAAREAGRRLAVTSGQQRTDALKAIAAGLREQTERLVAENAHDLAAAKDNGLTSAMIDRLRLDKAAVEKMARSVEEVAAQTDPVGQVIEGWVRPNGLRIEKRRVPIGVVAIIYEARPNVTSDAAALCLKSGNACILRGGKESFHSNLAIGQVISESIEKAGLPAASVQIVNTTDRGLVPILLKQEDSIDLVIPRGGESLIRAVVQESRIPVIKHYTGNCHVYVDEGCPAELAESVVLNAKTQRPGVCNAAESLLFHAEAASRLLVPVCRKLQAAGVEIRGCDRTRQLLADAKPATEDDWSREYLDLIISVKVVDSLEAAVEHINRYGSHHTDAILTHDVRAADAFVAGVDSGNVMVNCSTRFSDGGEYGLGAEIGISTDKLHARGPMGAADLTTYKWVVTGYGQLRR
ncbi:MAG TPA: glutamate-5-semialdehyde dehydrogenase [Phycisphaerae bacterium]|nr:glutamate-5-semialdehyde dehydrogenase [Phycisphaerae bacterium]HOJ75474.1 glutamate-5-semialdehyde dehydrogenase [Phycisphaerae bacterium]HOM52274.1 glutamate-5-semialdehyde dehydrogenase [Phycisphaerae bacterium]HOQ88233.1 glutamate-5-semialdehyde dehydrogenase [Phycisphaerae bacterium]HPP24942.1 glutamate-5-semialdehyde dehydrogenase [Phycisphaerae bacterium]